MSAGRDPRCPVCSCTTVAGVVVQRAYDGVLFWSCVRCGADFHRFAAGTERHAFAECMGVELEQTP